jgi:hypothetical protein
VIKLTQSLLSTIQYCFMVTFDRDQTEDRMLIYVNGAGELWAPTALMKRSAASVECDVPLSFERDGQWWDLAFDLHSHHRMGAFWSPTDNANERVRGPIFGVFSWKGGQPTWLFRRFTGTGWEDLPFEAVVVDG